MAAVRSRQREAQLRELLTRDHTLNGGILFGLDGYVIEVQARAMEVLKRPTTWPAATSISGMAGVAVREAATRIAGAFAKLRLSTDERFAETDGEQSPRLRARIEAARERQHGRFEGQSIPHNAAIPGGRVREYCRFSAAGLEAYKNLIDKHTLSTRSMDRLAKVARTVADLAGSEEVEPGHVAKAGSFVIGGMLRAVC